MGSSGPLRVRAAAYTCPAGGGRQQKRRESLLLAASGKQVQPYHKPMYRLSLTRDTGCAKWFKGFSHVNQRAYVVLCRLRSLDAIMIALRIGGIPCLCVPDDYGCGFRRNLVSVFIPRRAHFHCCYARAAWGRAELRSFRKESMQ